EHLGQAAGGGAAEELELEETILGHRVAGAEPQVVVGLAGHRRNAKGVADDGDARSRGLAGARLPQARVLEGEALEEVELVGQVRRAGAVSEPRSRHEAALTGRQNAARPNYARLRGTERDG